jgi:polysaccharide export outer membrane protein
MKTCTAPCLVALTLVAGSALASDDGLRLSLRLSDAPTTAVAAKPLAALPDASLAKGAIKDYRIGSEDLLDVQVFGVDQLSRTVRVNSRGQISLPLIGSIEVAGLTSQEAEVAITRRLSESFLQNPQVSLFIKEFTTQRITVDGAVVRPGVYPLKGPSTLLTALALAGGGGGLSDMTQVVLFRADFSGKRAPTVYDVERIRRGEIEDPVVVNEDLIVVNRSGNRVALKDSLFRDILDTINPFQWGAIR